MDSLKNLKKFEGVSLDEFSGIKSLVAKVELSEVESKDFGEGLKEVRQIKIVSQNLTDVEGKEMTATEYINLKNVDGQWGFSDSPKSKAQKILNFFKIEDFSQLEGKEIVVLKKSKENGKEFLGFNFGN